MTEDTTLDILLIEDEMSSTLLTERLKREFREKVNIHRNGHTIAKDLDIYTGKDLDIVILDEQYSDLNIIDAAKLIKKRKPEADIIVLTNEKEKALIFVDGGIHKKAANKADDDKRRKTISLAGFDVLVWDYTSEHVQSFVTRRQDIFRKVR